MTEDSVANKRHLRAAASPLNGEMTHLGELLRLYRAVHNVALRELADDIGIHFNTLNRFERTDTGMTAENFLKVLTWLLTVRADRQATTSAADAT